jgi:thiamine-phosphate pyrophosphorylase
VSRVPPLHIIADDAAQRDPAFASLAAELFAAGGERIALHLRGHLMHGRELFDNAVALESLAERSGAWLIVNDRVDVALAAGVSRVILGVRSLPVAAVRSLLGDDAVVGYSAHSASEAASAVGAGASFIMLGTIFETPSHPGRAGAGPALVGQVFARIREPVIAIGGITPARVSEVLAVGAAGVAVLSGVLKSADPVGAAREYLAALADAS